MVDVYQCRNINDKTKQKILPLYLKCLVKNKKNLNENENS